MTRRKYTPEELMQFRQDIDDGVHYETAGRGIGMPPSTAHGYSRAWASHRVERSKSENQYTEEQLEKFFDLLSDGKSKEEAAATAGIKPSTAHTYYRSFLIKESR